MSPFLTQLKAERAELLRTLNTDRLAELTRRRDRLRVELEEADRITNNKEPVNRVRAQLEPLDAEIMAIEAQQGPVTKNRLAEVEAMLNAGENVVRHRENLRRLNAELRQAEDERDRLADLSAGIISEINAAERQNSAAFAEFATKDIEARLAGDPAPKRPKAFDTSALAASIEAAESRLLAASAKVDELQGEIERETAAYLHARHALAQVRFNEALAGIMPAVADLLAAERMLGFGYRSEARIQADEADIARAREALERETAI